MHYCSIMCNYNHTLRIFQKISTSSEVIMALRTLKGSRNPKNVAEMFFPVQIALLGASDN